MTDGIINVNKPEGWTSQDICAKLRHRLHIKKIGHTGTLDPMATGVLPVCIGKATRIIEYYDRDRKTYRACMKLGYTSDTLDIWGNTEKTGGYSDVTEEMIKSAFAAYTGIIEQIPPKYSALRINGKRAYDLAREGQEFEIKPRRITIYSNTVASGFFRIEGSYGIDELVNMTDEELADCLIPMDSTLENLGTVELDDNRFTAFINGNPSGTGYRVVTESDFRAGDGDKYSGCSIYKVYSSGSFLGTGYIKGRDLIPAKVIQR